MNLDPILLKTDGRGRVRTPAAQREALLDEFERSALSGMRFAALHGVKHTRFANWVPRRRRERGTGGPGGTHGALRDSGDAVVQWLEAEVGSRESSSLPPGLMLHLPCGVRVELTHAHQIRLAAQLVQALTLQASTTGTRPAPLPC